MPVSLPVHLHRELELSRVIGSGSLASVGEERADRGNVVPVGDVKHIDDEVSAESLGEVDALGDAQITKSGPGRYSRVPAEISVELQQRGNDSSGYKSIDTRLMELPGGRGLVSLLTFLLSAP